MCPCESVAVPSAAADPRAVPFPEPVACGMRHDRLRVTLPNGWEQLDNPEGPATFARITDPTGAFQVSQAMYESGEVPNPSHADLIALSRTSAESLGFQVIQTSSGKCALGDFGLSISEQGP